MSHNPVKVALFSLTVTLVGLIQVNCDRILRSDRTTNWGGWGPWEWCPEDDIVVAFKIRVEAFQRGQDNTGLNSIQLYCDNQTDPWSSKGQQTVLYSSSKNWGTWREYNRCPGKGYLIGFELKVQPPAPSCRDDTAADDFNGYCREGKKIDILKGNAGENFPMSKWQRAKLCPDGYAVCGMRTQVEVYQGYEDYSFYCTDVDDSALNNVDMYCCYLGLRLAGGVPEIFVPRPTDAPITGG